MTADFAGRVWVDGAVVPLDQARIPVTDRGFLLADSIFETIRTYGGRPFLLGDHLDRLRRSAGVLWLPVPWSDERLCAAIEQVLADLPPGQEASIRLMITRGDGGHGLAFPEQQQPRLVILCRPLVPPGPELYRSGVSIGLPRSDASRMRAVPAHVKSGSYLVNILALREAREAGRFEALLRGKDGSWSEATTSNLFVVAGGSVRTPPATGHLLPGITRALVLELARRDGIPVQEDAVDDAGLLAADEIFLTSSIKEVMPVTSVDGRLVGDGGPGEISVQLHRKFAEGVAEIMASKLQRLSDWTAALGAGQT